MTSTRVTITLPEDTVREIDSRDRNRSRFVQRAIAGELERLREEELQRSLDRPHAESEMVAESGLVEWGGHADFGDSELLDASMGRSVHWDPGLGWVEEEV